MMAAAAQKSGVVVPHQAKWYQKLAAALVVFLIRTVAMTVRSRLEDRSGYFQSSPPPGKFIIAIWHNRLALSAILYHRYVRKFEPGRQFAAIASASRDGAFLAQILEDFGIVPIRGSSSRRGAQALVELTSCAELGYDLAVTPDGPRGPCYEAQGGVVVTAQLTGLPIIPVSYHLNWKIRLKSWDRFQIPLPFARCEVITGKPIFIPREISDEQREIFRKQLEQALREITRD
ncbi:MAG TPA: lysophospholipid acyltransferase family protein [Candidatus Acidoferrum sp.]|jgi:lysophospholipid acyltransferase (LPLAT)-like uncharacterized protein|nr:lysophospholipid acyltransferase family protein [Candidatus Acidoferrum sp.]